MALFRKYATLPDVVSCNEALSLISADIQADLYLHAIGFRT